MSFLILFRDNLFKKNQFERIRDKFSNNINKFFCYYSSYKIENICKKIDNEKIQNLIVFDENDFFLLKNFIQNNNIMLEYSLKLYIINGSSKIDSTPNFSITYLSSFLKDEITRIVETMILYEIDGLKNIIILEDNFEKLYEFNYLLKNELSKTNLKNFEIFNNNLDFFKKYGDENSEEKKSIVIFDFSRRFYIDFFYMSNEIINSKIKNFFYGMNAYKIEFDFYKNVLELRDKVIPNLKFLIDTSFYLSTFDGDYCNLLKNIIQEIKLNNEISKNKLKLKWRNMSDLYDYKLKNDINIEILNSEKPREFKFINKLTEKNIFEKLQSLRNLEFEEKYSENGESEDNLIYTYIQKIEVDK